MNHPVSTQFFIYALCITGGYSHQHFFIRENLNFQQIPVQQIHQYDYLFNSSVQFNLLYRLALSEHLLSTWRNGSSERHRTLEESVFNRIAIRKALSLSRTAQQLTLSSSIFGSNISDGDSDSEIAHNLNFRQEKNESSPIPFSSLALI